MSTYDPAKRYIRCTGIACTHIEGTCTASDEYQSQFAGKPAAGAPEPLVTAQETATLLHVKPRTPSEQIEYCIGKLNEQLAPSQVVVDGVVLALQQTVDLVRNLEERDADRTEPSPPDDTLPIGTVVTLKAGGPLMTVTGRDEHNKYTVVWFDESQRAQQILNMPFEAFRVKRED